MFGIAVVLMTGLGAVPAKEPVRNAMAEAEVPAGTSAAPQPAWIERGDRVEARWRAYADRLGPLRDKLRQSVSRDAPDLFPTLKRVPAPVTPQGYQVLPKLAEDPPAPAAPPRSAPASYSWPWTDRLIDREAQDIGSFEAELQRTADLAPTERRAVYEKLIASYRHLIEGQGTIDAHVRYNRQWQAAIAADRPTYDRDTTLLHAALERQAIRDALVITDDAAFRAAVGRIAGIDASKDRPGLVMDLRARETSLSRTIHDVTDRAGRPSFVRVEHPTPRLWIVRVPIYTDITAPKFVEGFKAAVERVWSLRDRGDEFRVRLTMVYVSPARLYRGRTPPAPGAQIDLHAHATLFPGDGGVLTTGAALTHVTEGRCIALGPHDIAGHVLAHEFGHVLGFQDVYFRGYRDLGADGYEVTEVVAEPADIMGAPGAGAVQRHLFEKLIGQQGSHMDAQGSGDASGNTGR